MWVKIDLDDFNIKINEYIETALMMEGKPYNIKMMKFKHGLWWGCDDVYSCYAPTHFWRD